MIDNLMRNVTTSNGNATSVQPNQAAAVGPPPSSGIISNSISPQNQNQANSASVLQQNQAAELSLFQQTQASRFCNQAAVLPHSNIHHQHNQAARPSILLPHNQPSFGSFRAPSRNYIQRNQPSVPPIIHPQGMAATIPPSTLQQNQVAGASISQGKAATIPPSTLQQNQAAGASIPKAKQQTSQSPNNVGSTVSKIFTKKRCLEALFDENNELPGKLKHLRPNLIERILDEIVDPHAIVKWDDIAGLQHAKYCVHENVLWPVLNPRIFEGVCSIGKGILLFGPPGTGKTMIGKAIAGDMKATFFNLSTCSLVSMWLGESEMLVRALFGLARHLQPSVIFLDEVDSLLRSRSSQTEHEAFRRVKTQVLVEMEGIDSGTEQIIVIGATNRPQDLDEVARRLGKRLYIPLPCSEARLEIICNTMEKVGKYVLSKQDLDLIRNLTDGYSGSDMKNLVKEAVMGPIRDAIRDVKNGKDIRELEPEDLTPVALRDFQNALKDVRPSVSQQELDAYVEWNAKFGSMPL
ncbi:hypothetical protein DITRI_Ditri02bG0110600 [Diplodiscus trichospermus]